ncbi:MAG: hypothetical protein ACRD35_02530 [Candidatus Acidiferrales bacterium]
MKPKTLIALVFLLHVLVHPAVHGVLVPPAASTEFRTPPDSETSTPRAEALGPCLACRGAASAVTPPAPLAVQSLDANWEPLSPPEFPYLTQAFARAVAARAPPLA